jgi:hypothetical protein
MVKPKENKKAALSNEIVRDITFFEEDIKELSKQLSSAEGLYNNFYKNVYDSIVGGKYSAIKSHRDIAEITKALVSLRSICVDTAFKRHQVRKNLSDIVHREAGGELSDVELIKNTARTIISEVRNFVGNSNENLNASGEGNLSNKKETIEELDLKVEEYIENGDIRLSANDKLIGVSNFVEFKFDINNDAFIAFDSRTGMKIKDFPEERLPEKKISKILTGEVITKTGDSYEIIGD